jgi:hypothetical protein
MSQNTTDGIQNVLDDYPMFIDESSIVYCLILRKFEFDLEFIEKNRLKFRKNTIDNYFKSRMEKANSDKQKMLHDFEEKKLNPKEWKRNSHFSLKVICNMDWPLCIYDTYYKHDITEFFIFRTIDPPKFIEDYFFTQLDDNRSNKTFIGSSENVKEITKNLSGIKENLQKFRNKRKQSSVEEENSESLNDSDSESNFQFMKRSQRNLNETKRVKLKEKPDSYMNENEESKTKLFENYYEKVNDDYNNLNEITNYIEEHENENEEECELTIVQYVNETENVEKIFEKVYKPFENLIIERRPHYCHLLFPKKSNPKLDFRRERKIISFSDKNSRNSKEIYVRNGRRTLSKQAYRHKIKFKKYKTDEKSKNRSFTAINPYMLINFDKMDNSEICNNMITTIRKNFEGTDNKFLSISEFNLIENPFSPKEDLFIFSNLNENDDI